MALPPGPRGPALLHTARFMRDPLAFLERCRRRYGDVFRIRFIGMGDLVYFVDPAHIKEIFTGDPELLHAGEANQVLEPVLGPRSVLLLDGKAHMRQRRLLLPAFQGDNVRRYGELMQDIALKELVGWPRGEPVAMRPRMQAITLEVILRAVFGIRQADRLARLRTLLPPLLNMSNAIVWLPFLRREFPFGPWKRFVRARDEVDEIIYDEIQRRRDETDLGGRGDVLSLLLQARDEDGEPMTDAELRDELVTLLLAGHETTAIGLAWALERLAHNSEVQERLAGEIENGDDRYLEATIKETLRSRTVVFDIARYLKAPFSVRGHQLPEGIHVVPALALVHRMASLYPEPARFRPERFLEGQDESYSWIPFGGGVRRCIGATFASFEMKVVLRALLARIAVEPARTVPEKAKFRNVTLVPARGAELVLRDRPAPPAGGRHDHESREQVAGAC